MPSNILVFTNENLVPMDMDAVLPFMYSLAYPFFNLTKLKRNNVLRIDMIILETELGFIPKVQLGTNIVYY